MPHCNAIKVSFFRKVWAKITINLLSSIKICNFEGYKRELNLLKTMKDTLKLLEQLEESLDRVVENGIYEIERDLLLERLRGIYATVVATEAVAEEERVLDALMGIGAAAALEPLEPEIEVERLYDEAPEEVMYGCPYAEFEAKPEEEPIPEPEVEEEPVLELIEEPTVEPAEELVDEIEEPTEGVAEEPTEGVAEEPAEEPVEEVVEPSEEIDHEALISLYDDDDEEDEPQLVVSLEESEEPEDEEIAPEPTPKPEVKEDVVAPEEPTLEEVVSEEEPAKEEVISEEEPAMVVLGDVLSGEPAPTLADNLAEQKNQDVASAASASLSLRESIGINDKYILLRDLFAGDGDYYNEAIEHLDSFESLDEAMLYIYDNFHWNPNSKGARLLMELLARKLF